MRVRLFARLCACAIVLSGTTSASAQGDPIADIQKQIDALKKQGNYSVGAGSLAIESWLLTSTAIDSTADRIQALVEQDVKDLFNKRTNERLAAAAGKTDDGGGVQEPDDGSDEDDDRRRDQETESEGPDVLVMTGDEPIDFTQAAMIEAEIDYLQARFDAETGSAVNMASAGPLISMAGSLISLFKTDTELSAIEQKVDAKLLAAAVAQRLSKYAVLPSALVAPQTDGALVRSFQRLTTSADAARTERDSLALKASKNPPELSEPQKNKLARLTALLTRFDAFFARVTTATAATNGVVPLTYADRLHGLIKSGPYILRVNTEKAGGTLLKRTNIVTALGGESTFVSGGLVSSYQLTDPTTGKVLKAGVITCRTTLTSLKRVQDGSWKSAANDAKAVCLP